MIDPFAPLDEIKARIDRLVKGEDITEPIATAGGVPFYYGRATTSDVAELWLRMAVTCRECDRAFYLSNAIGWASRE